MHHHGRRDVADPGSDRARQRGAFYSAAGSSGIHERHRGVDRQHADQRFLWTEDHESFGRFHWPRGSAGEKLSYILQGGDDPWTLFAGTDPALRAVYQAFTGIY